MRQVGDFGRLAQELRKLDMARLEIGGIELRPCGIAQLLGDLANVLLDARRGADGLLVLQAGQRRLVLLVGKIDADRAGYEDCESDQGEDQEQVLSKQRTLVRGGARRGWAHIRIAPKGRRRGWLGIPHPITSEARGNVAAPANYRDSP
jgi:hypothetical protein